MNSFPYWKLALKSRRLGMCLIAMFVVSLIIAAATFSTYSFLNVGEVVTPVAWLIPILSGVLVATGTGVDLSSFETLETGRLTRLLPFVLVVLAVASVLSIILGHTISALLQDNAMPGSLVLHSVVSTLGWSSLALISALTIGRQFSFLLPTAYFMFVTLFGYDDDNCHLCLRSNSCLLAVVRFSQDPNSRVSTLEMRHSHHLSRALG